MPTTIFVARRIVTMNRSIPSATHLVVRATVLGGQVFAPA